MMQFGAPGAGASDSFEEEEAGCLLSAPVLTHSLTRRTLLTGPATRSLTRLFIVHQYSLAISCSLDWPLVP